MRAAWVLIGAALVLTSGCAQQDWIDRTLETADLTGVWQGTVKGLGFAGGGDMRLDLQQKGPIVTGQMQFYGRQAGDPLPPSDPIEGTLASDVFKFKNARGSFTAGLTVDGDEMKGHSASTTQFEISLRRVDPSSAPALPPR